MVEEGETGGVGRVWWCRERGGGVGSGVVVEGEGWCIRRTSYLVSELHEVLHLLLHVAHELQLLPAK